MKAASKAIVRETGRDRSGEFLIEVATSAGECAFVVPKAMADKVRRGDIVTVSIEVDE